LVRFIKLFCRITSEQKNNQNKEGPAQHKFMI
jgi:hypothetical protein